MKVLCVLFTGFIFTACNTNTPPENIDAKLRSLMLEHLYKSVSYDSANVKYQIEKLFYFDDKIRKHYICDFQVRMITKKGLDTTGNMRAYVSEDFKKIDRTN